MSLLQTNDVIVAQRDMFAKLLKFLKTNIQNNLFA